SNASSPLPASCTAPIAIPVWRSTRCRILRVAVESSTNKTSGAMASLLYSSVQYAVFVSREHKDRGEEAGPPAAQSGFCLLSPSFRRLKFRADAADQTSSAVNRQLTQQEIDAVFRRQEQ